MQANFVCVYALIELVLHLNSYIKDNNFIYPKSFQQVQLLHPILLSSLSDILHKQSQVQYFTLRLNYLWVDVTGLDALIGWRALTATNAPGISKRL